MILDKRKRDFLFYLGTSAVALGFAIFVACPAFPEVSMVTRWLKESPLETFHPAFIVYFQTFFKLGTKLLNLPFSNAFFLCNFTLLLGCFWATYAIAMRLFDNWRGCACLTGFLVITFPWANKYLMLTSYALWPAFLKLLSLSVFLGISQKKDDSIVLRLLWGILGGILGCLVLSGPAAILEASVLFMSFLIYERWMAQPGQRARALALMGGALLVVLPFVGSYSSQLIHHVVENLNENHILRANLGTGLELDPVHFGFIKMLWLAGRFHVLWFFVSFALFLFHFQKGRVPHPVALLILVTVCGIALIDFLPTTKLARTYFPSVPLVLILSAWTMIALVRNIQLKRVGTALLTLFPILIFLGAVESAKIGRIIQKGPVQISQFPKDTKFYAMKLDPFFSPEDEAGNKSVSGWLQTPVTLVSSMEEIFRTKGNSPAFLLVGPHGPGSGLTAYKASLDPNFVISERFEYEVHAPKHYSVPVIGFHPFLFTEEELSFNLWDSGLRPDPSDQHLQLIFYAI